MFQSYSPLLFTMEPPTTTTAPGRELVARIKVACKLQPDLSPFHHRCPKEQRCSFQPPLLSGLPPPGHWAALFRSPESPLAASLSNCCCFGLCSRCRPLESIRGRPERLKCQIA